MRLTNLDLQKIKLVLIKITMIVMTMMMIMMLITIIGAIIFNNLTVKLSITSIISLMILYPN